ncbi:MAG TPA: MFS transporter [Ktedonosporobacter sp.]|nr:MFS transporter [Ktedonosporobacter sp.]
MFFKRNSLNAYRLFLLQSAIHGLAWGCIVTINLVYQVEIVRLNPLQLVLVGTMLETVAFISQIPTGVLADVYSRRLAVVVGFFLMGIGFLLEGLVPRFDTVLVSQVFWGVGITFIDGAREAWIASEVGEEAVGRAFLHGSQVYRIVYLLAIPVSVALATIRLNLPIIVGAGIFLLLSLLLLLVMPENNFVPTPREERGSWRQMGAMLATSGKAIWRSPTLLIIMAITFCNGMGSEGFDRLQTDHFIQDFSFPALGHLQPVIWFGIMSAVGTLLIIGTTELVRRYIDINNHRAIVYTLFAFNVLLLVSVVTFGLAGNFFIALVAYWSASVFRQADMPIYMTWLTRNSDPKMRATIISMAGQSDAIGQITGGPVIGLVGTFASLRAAIVTTGLILTPNVFLFARALRKDKDIAAVVADEEDSKPATML